MHGYRVQAVSRTPPSGEAVRNVEWLVDDVTKPSDHLLRSSNQIIFCAPTVFAGTFFSRIAQAHPEPNTVRTVVFSSTSVVTKANSPDAEERETAIALARSEKTVLKLGPAVSTTILRPTLIYGAPGDRNIEYIARRSRRIGLFPVARNGGGLRQPVHGHDLAVAALRALVTPAAVGKTYNLGGGEVLSVKEMIRRASLVNGGSVRFVSLPTGLLTDVTRLARASGMMKWLPVGSFARITSDLVFDNGPAIADLAYRPRRFEPPVYPAI
mgnify:CR=1 FL=1